MPIVQITYDVPPDVAKGLATGELSMLGTAAVRNSKHIAAHTGLPTTATGLIPAAQIRDGNWPVRTSTPSGLRTAGVGSRTVSAWVRHPPCRRRLIVPSRRRSVTILELSPPRPLRPLGSGPAKKGDADCRRC